MVNIVGIGPGNRDYILPKAISVLNNSDYVIGFSRAVESIEFLNCNSIKVKSLKEILSIIEKKKNINISIIASGDPTFYGITNYIKNNYQGNIEVIPGISSFQYLTCKMACSWNDGFLGSLHGREAKFIECVKNNKVSIWLTDNENTPNFLCEKLDKENINCKVIVGENLSYSDEKITIGNPRDIKENKYSFLSIMIVEVED